MEECIFAESGVTISPPSTDGKGLLTRYRRELQEWDKLQDSLCESGKSGVEPKWRALLALECMKDPAETLVRSIAKDVLHSKFGIRAIIDVLCPYHPFISAKERYAAWVTLTETKRKARESFRDFIGRFENNYSDFIVLYEKVVPSSITDEIFGFQMLRGAKLAGGREALVLKHAMMYESERRSKVPDAHAPIITMAAIRHALILEDPL